jgi:hypothetical protein
MSRDDDDDVVVQAKLKAKSLWQRIKDWFASLVHK